MDRRKQLGICTSTGGVGGERGLIGSLSMFPNSLAVSRVTLLALVSMSACRGPAHNESRSPTAHSSSPALTGPKAPELQRCNAAREQARMALDAGVQAGQAFASATTACADLYSEPGCANAFRAAATSPVESRAARIAHACRDAYCPKFASLKPAFCAPEAGQSPSQMLTTWPELDTRILSFELKVPVEEVERLLPRPSPPVVDVVRTNTVIPVQRSNADAGSPTSVVTVSLGIDANGRARTWVDSDPPEVLPAKIDVSSFATIAANAKKQAATEVVIAVDERTTYSHVVALIDALQKVGITHIAMQRLPLAERQNTTKP